MTLAIFSLLNRTVKSETGKEHKYKNLKYKILIHLIYIYCKPLCSWIEVSATVERMYVNNSNCDS